MDERANGWIPSKDEVDLIREELRPLLTQMARRDSDTLAQQCWRRDTFV